LFSDLIRQLKAQVSILIHFIVGVVSCAPSTLLQSMLSERKSHEHSTCATGVSITVCTDGTRLPNLQGTHDLQKC
jgi:hypothetical protein